MRLAIVSDIHGGLRRLQAVLDDLEDTAASIAEARLHPPAVPRLWRAALRATGRI